MMMKYLALCIVLVGMSSAERYSQLSVGAALESPSKLLYLYSAYTQEEHKEKSAPRLELFKKTLQMIAKENAEHSSWTLGINKFSDLTMMEKRHYLGMNSTAHRMAKRKLRGSMRQSEVPNLQSATEKDWRKEGKVTGVKDQGECGSCWAFGAVGPIETNYAVLTGKLKSFSEKEFLDCVFGHEDGCQGGFYENCWTYAKRTGHLSLTDDAPYDGKSERCGQKYKRTHNALIAAKIRGGKGYYSIPAGEKNMIAHLEKGAVGIAFEVTDNLFSYQKGIIEDKTCSCGNKGCGKWGKANHAVTAVGYTPKSMIVKNSWGTNWGMKGYFETARGTDLCEYFRWGAIPLLRKTGVKDNDPAYVPSEEGGCEGKNPDGCACGTVRCGDGKCRHAHMCNH